MIEALNAVSILSIVGGIFLIVAVVALLKRFKNVSPEEAMIITGSMLGKKGVYVSENGDRTKIIKGGNALVLPLIQMQKTLNLKTHMITVTTPEVYSSQGVPVMVDSTTIIKIGSTIEDIARAAERFLGKDDETLQREVREVLEGHLRSILGSMTVEDIYRNRDKFAQDVQKVAVIDLKKMGLAIDSFTIKDVRDKHDYLASLGKPRIAQVKRDADIAEAEAFQEARVKKAESEQVARQAELEREAQIQEATKEKDLKVSQFREEADKAKARADVAYEVQKAISDKEAVEASMEVAKLKLARETELAEKQVELTKQKLDADVKARADAELYERTQRAQAAKVEQESKAQADATTRRLQAEADSKAKELEGKAQAEVIKAQGLAEAESKRQQGTADAEVAERLARVEVDKELGLADAALKLGQLRYIELITSVLPDIAGKIAEPMANIGKLTIIDANGTGADGGGMGKITNQVTSLMKFLPEVVNDLTGINMADILANVSGGRLSGAPFDPNSLQQLLKHAKGVDPETVKTLTALLSQENLLSGDQSADSENINVAAEMLKFANAHAGADEVEGEAAFESQEDVISENDPNKN